MPVECANPLLLRWVGEWLEQARERNSKGVQVYKKAYDSIKSCPLAFSHPSEAQQLHGLGPKLCDRLTQKLQAYCDENGLPMPELPYKSNRKSKENDDDQADQPARKARKPKAYVPTLRSGPYAIILALSTVDEESGTGLTKAETIELAQPYCDSSFSAPSDPTKFYTAWNSMKTLLGKDLVYERGRPLRRYALTEEGWDVAKHVRQTADPDQLVLDKFVGAITSTKLSSAENAPTVSSQLPRPAAMEDEDGFIELDSSPVRTNSTSAAHSVEPLIQRTNRTQNSHPFNETSLPTFIPITVLPSSFTVQLVLDVREIRATKDRDYMQDELAKKGVKPIMRALELGDALWVAKMNDPNFLAQHGAEGDEIVLDWIVERKRLDDLVGSIKDGRFHEQKFRLRRSAVKNVIYIIEEISMNADHFQRYEEAVESAIASTQVVNGYFVKRTQKMDDTIRYLARMTVMLKEVYEKTNLHVIPTAVLTSQNYNPLIQHLRKVNPSQNHYITYPAFGSLASKSETLTLRDVYLKMLMCTKGVTGEKGVEIQKRWKTPSEFARAFEECGPDEEGKKRKREMIGMKMGNLVARKKVAKMLSSKIADVWGDV
jgi:crossover junction endonuclease MUS81